MKALIPGLVWIAVLIAFIVVYAGSAAWVIGDAQKRGRSGSVLFLLLFLCGPLSALFIWFFLCGSDAPWMDGDAQKRGYSGGVLILLLWLCGPVSALVWLFVRPDTTLNERKVDDYANADDAIDAAAKLNMLGDWDEAVVLYEYVAARWPEHKAYINSCIKGINDKRAAN